MTGFLPIPRDQFSDYLWQSKTAFDFFDAYLDLQQIACFTPTRKVIKNKLITLDVGELVASERYLQNRWGWSRTKVRNYLSNLKKDHLLDRRKDQGETVLILCKYWVVADGQTEKKPANRPQKKPQTRPEENQRRTKEEEVKEIEEEKNTPPSPPGGRKDRRPTADELIDSIPDDFPDELRPIAKDLAKARQSYVPASKRFGTLRAFEMQCQRMRLYPVEIVKEAVAQAIEREWKSWEQDSVKVHLIEKPKVEYMSGFREGKF